MFRFCLDVVVSRGFDNLCRGEKGETIVNLIR